VIASLLVEHSANENEASLIFLPTDMHPIFC